MDILLMALLGYVIGAVFRTAYDYLWKALEDESVIFDTKYWFTMVVSIILSIMSAMVTFTTLQFLLMVLLGFSCLRLPQAL